MAHATAIMVAAQVNGRVSLVSDNLRELNHTGMIQPYT
jgi:hypothetical protein